MIKVNIGWGKDYMSYDLQEKTFKDEMSAVEWCRKNYQKIQHINFHTTLGQQISHFEIMDYLRDKG